MRTSELRWRPSPVTRRRRRRAERFRLLDEPPFVTQNPAEEKAALAARVLANDTPTGRRRNMHELEGELAPDLPADRFGERFSLMALVTAKGNLKYNPAFGAKYDVKSQERGYKWAFWKVRAVRCALAAVYISGTRVRTLAALPRSVGAGGRLLRTVAGLHRRLRGAVARALHASAMQRCGAGSATTAASAPGAGAGARPGAQQR